MESIGKRLAREESSSDEEGCSSQNSDEPRHKRVRHDSSSSDSEQYDEEALLNERVRQELMEEEALKHLTDEQIQALINQADDIEEVKLDKVQVRRMVTQLRQSLNANLELRMKHAGEPESFLDSEAELHSNIKALQQVSAYPQFTGDLIQAEGIDALVEVLDHPNPDIAIESVILLTELTDEDLTLAKDVVGILIQNEVWNFLIRHLSKLDDAIDDERKSISHCLKLLENLLDEEPETASNKLMHVDTLIDWLLLFLERGNPSSDNYLHSAELLCAIVQNSHEEYRVKFTVTLSGLERVLGVLNGYRKKTLELEEEHEALVNVLDIICSLMLVQECSEQFRRMQGFELLMSLCKKQSELRRNVIKVFDYALTNNPKNNKYFIEQGGLPIVFGFFMLKDKPKKAVKKNIENTLYIKVTKEDRLEDEKHTMNIISSLLCNSEGEDSQLPHERVIFKFIENSYEKLQRLFELHLKYNSIIEEFDLSQFNAKEELDFLLQDYPQFEVLAQVDVLIGFLHMSGTAQRLSAGKESMQDKVKEFMKFNGVHVGDLGNVVRLGALMQEEASGEYTMMVARVLEHLQDLANGLSVEIQWSSSKRLISTGGSASGIEGMQFFPQRKSNLVDRMFHKSQDFQVKMRHLGLEDQYRRKFFRSQWCPCRL